MSILGQRLAALRAREAARDPDVSETMTQHIDSLRRQGATLRALQAGSRIPEFTLRDHQARLVSSAELLASAPLVIAFMRGTWCSYSEQELAALTAAFPTIHKFGANVIVLSPQSPQSARKHFRSQPTPFPILVDRDAIVAESFGLDYHLPGYLIDTYRNRLHIDLAEVNAGGSWRLPTPGRYVVDRGGVIVDAIVDPDHRFRTDIDPTLQAVQRLALTVAH